MERKWDALTVVYRVLFDTNVEEGRLEPVESNRDISDGV